jgi:hypothetical protein
MKRFLISILALLCIAGESFAQIPELKPLKDLEDVLNPAEKKGKWGYANGSGKMIIKAVFDAADPFETVVSADGTIMEVARIKANGCWGYITRENVYLIEPIYDDITHFDRFSTVVAKSGPFNALIGVRTTTSPRLNIPVLASSILQLNLSEIGEFMDNGLALAYKAGKCGMLDYKGNWAIPCRYDSMDINADGGYDIVFEGKCGILKADGAILVEPLYDSIVKDASLGGYRVTKEGLQGIVGEDGHRIAPPIYEDIKADAALGLIVVKEGHQGLLSVDGRILLDTAYSSIAPCGSVGYAVVKDGLNGVVSRGDDLVLDFGSWTADPAALFDKYTSVKWLDVLKLFLVGGTEGFGLVDEAGELMISPVYDDLIKLPRGFLVAKGEQKAIVEPVDNIIIGLGTWKANPEYLLVAPYDTIAWNQETGYFEVTRDGKYGLLDAEGKEIMPCEYDEVPDPNAPVVEEPAPEAEPVVEEAPEGVPPAKTDDTTEDDPVKSVPTE